MTAKKNIAIASACAVVVVAAVVFLLARPTGAKGDALAARENVMEELGARIAKLRPKANVLVLSNPFTKSAGHFDEKSQFERAGLNGLRAGLGDAEVTVVFPEIRPEYVSSPETAAIPPDSRTPLSFLMQASSVDQLADGNPKCNVIVSLIGLPLGVDQLKVWGEKDPRSFALLFPDLRVIGEPAAVVEAFRRGKLLAAVFEDPKSGAPLIVTQENIAEVMAQQPKIFGF